LAIPALSNDVVENLIFPNLSLPELGVCCRVCNAWNKIAKEQIKFFSYPNAFGPKEWFIHFGSHLRNVPRLPSNIGDILSSSCPFWPDNKVYETHLLVLVPQNVGEQPLTLKTLGELVKKPLQGHATKYGAFYMGKYVDQPAKSHWALLTRTVVKGSRSKPYKDEQAVLAQNSQKTNLVYEIPTVLDAAVCNMMEYVRCGAWLYGENPLTYTWCQEKYNANWNLVVGGGCSSGLVVRYDNASLVVSYDNASEDCGVGGLRKF
jgi:hypothetical protein